MMVMRSIADSGDRRPSRRSRSYSAIATMRHSTKDVREWPAGSVRAPSRLPGRALRHLLATCPAPLSRENTHDDAIGPARPRPLDTTLHQRVAARTWTPNGFESVAGEQYDRWVLCPMTFRRPSSSTPLAPSTRSTERHATGATGTRQRDGSRCVVVGPDLRFMRHHAGDETAALRHHFRHHTQKARRSRTGPDLRFSLVAGVGFEPTTFGL
jgi:hypothetical protein